MEIDFERWAVFAPKNASGFGRMAEDIKAVLGFRTHFIADYENLESGSPQGKNEYSITSKDELEKVVATLGRVAGLQGIVFFERNSWNPHLFAASRQLGIKTVCVPMWEWFRGSDREWRDCDLFVCPSEFALSIVRSYRFANAVYLPWPFNLSQFPARQIKNPARLFIHNAGLVDVQDRKGTADTIRAFRRVKRPDIRLVVRMQAQAELPAIDDRIEVIVDNVRDPSSLYLFGDAAIQPSKMEGIGFMVIEPVASGIPTLTLDYPPMNTYVSQPEMLVRKKWFKRRAFPSRWVKHAHLRLPSIGDLSRKILWCARHDLGELSRKNRTWAEQMFDPERLRQRWLETLSRTLGK